MSKKNKKQDEGPSITSEVKNDQEEWHTATSDDEEAYANEMKQLYKE